MLKKIITVSGGLALVAMAVAVGWMIYARSLSSQIDAAIRQWEQAHPGALKNPDAGMAQQGRREMRASLPTSSGGLDEPFDLIELEHNNVRELTNTVRFIQNS